MSELIWSGAPESARRPILLAAFRGVFDAGEAATSALEWIISHAEESTEIGHIDAEGFVNFQESRPMVRFGPDGLRELDWPHTRLHRCRTEGARDLVVVVGDEPHLRWRHYSELLAEVVRATGSELVITVGAYVSMVPHTRPLPVTGSTADTDLGGRLNLGQPSYEGPTGIVGVLTELLDRSAVPNASLRVGVPHYVPAAPSPKATRALLRRLQQLVGVPTHYEELDEAVNEWLGRVDDAVASDEDNIGYVRRLEAQIDSDESSLPSGDDLAAELEAFLRDHRRSDPDEGGDGDD